MSAVIAPSPSRYMRGLANANFRDLADIYRNDGYGWDHIGRVRCNIHHILTPPVPGDPMDSSAAQSQAATIDVPKRIAVKIGDRIVVRGDRWIVGDGNFDETNASYLHLSVARPTAATPRIWITVQRYNAGVRTALAPQLVQIAWSRNQPDRLGGVSIRQYGWMFSPDGAPDLDIQQGDTFAYDGNSALVQWVPPDTADRREAIFWINTGEGV